MKTITDTRDHCDDVDMTVEQIVARIRWLEKTLMALQGERAPRIATTRTRRRFSVSTNPHPVKSDNGASK
jgi:hypothetical protein